VIAPTFEGGFAHHWIAEILSHRPMILPNRHYVYPAAAEEVERGALEVLIQPVRISTGNTEGDPQNAQSSFLATCALGFRDPAVPTGIWSCPHPDWLCAVSGGYAYLIDTAQPERFTFLRYRPVLEILRYAPETSMEPSSEDRSSLDKLGKLDKLLLFAGHHSILAWGRDGEVWESERLSLEGITDLRIEGKILRGEGWDLRTDKDTPFALDIENGRRI
jgi:hypothetical protein